MKNALLLTFGSRGDVEPFIALALGLSKRDWRVTLCTASRYRDWIEGFGVASAPMTSELLEIMETQEGRAMLEGSAGMIGAIRTGLKLAGLIKPINAQMMHDAWSAAKTVRPDVVIYHPKVLAAPHIAEALGVPAVMAAFQPMIVPTNAFPAAGMPRLPIPGYNRLSYKAIPAAYGTYKKAVNSFRTNELGLGPIRRNADMLALPALRDIPVLHALSGHVVPAPADWPPHAHMVGYWRLPPDPSYRAPEDLAAFLESGTPPVYVGFGSMTVKDPEGLTKLILEALDRAEVRGVVSAGWAGLNASERNANVHFVGNVPHAWLFPRMAAVVHHGGAGTTASSFLAGVPTVVCPFIADQPFWAQRSVDLRVGAPPVPRKKMTAERLAASIRVAVGNPTIKENATALAARLSQEDGVATAIRHIEQACMAGEAMTNEF